LSFGSNGSQRHNPTPLNPDRYSALSVRTREVKALMVRRILCETFFIGDKQKWQEPNMPISLESLPATF